MARYTELIQAKVEKAFFSKLILYCHENKISVSKLIRDKLKDTIEGGNGKSSA